MTRNSKHGTQKPSAWYAIGLNLGTKGRKEEWMNGKSHILRWLHHLKKRDKAKHDASTLAKAGENATTAWADYRKIRNKINNRLR